MHTEGLCKSTANNFISLRDELLHEKKNYYRIF